MADKHRTRGGKWWDIIPPKILRKKSREEEIPQSVYQEAEAHSLPSEIMIKELWERGTSIERIFGLFYELEAIADAHSDEIFGNDEEGQHGDPNRFKSYTPLTVGDAHLAGVVPPLQPKRPLGRIPF